MEQMLKHFIGHVPNDINELRKIAESLDKSRLQICNSILDDATYDSDDSAVADECFMFKEISGNVTREWTCSGALIMYEF